MLRKILKVVFVGIAMLTSGSSIAAARTRPEETLGLCSGTFTIKDSLNNNFLYCAVESTGSSLVGSSYNISKKLTSENSLVTKENVGGKNSIEICNKFNSMSMVGYSDFLFSAIKTIGEDFDCGAVLNPEGGIGIDQLPAITECLQKAADKPIPSSSLNVTNIDVSQPNCLRRSSR